MFYKNLFYFDIETTGGYSTLEEFEKNDYRGYKLFVKKYENNPWMKERSDTVEKAYLDNSPIFSTYGKIVCISFGYFNNKNAQGYTISSIYGNDEKNILVSFKNLLEKVSNKGMLLSGYRIKSFDVPWVVHKMNKYDIELPNIIDIYGKKPWEVATFDLADEWKHQFKYYVSFDEVAYELGIDSPKDGISGADVHRVYWEENDIEKIKNYCEKDVLTSLKVGERMLKNKI